MNFLFLGWPYVTKNIQFFPVFLSNVSLPLPLTAGKSYSSWKYDPFILIAFWSLMFQPFLLSNFPSCLLGNWPEESRIYSGITGGLTKTVQYCKIFVECEMIQIFFPKEKRKKNPNVWNGLLIQFACPARRFGTHRPLIKAGNFCVIC